MAFFLLDNNGPFDSHNFLADQMLLPDSYYSGAFKDLLSILKEKSPQRITFW